MVPPSEISSVAALFERKIFAIVQDVLQQLKHQNPKGERVRALPPIHLGFLPNFFNMRLRVAWLVASRATAVSAREMSEVLARNPILGA